MIVGTRGSRRSRPASIDSISRRTYSSVCARTSSKSVEIFNEQLRYHGPYVEGAIPLTEDSDHALVVAEFE